MSQKTLNQSSPPNQSQFATGFLIGILGGLAAYLLRETKQGRQLRTKFVSYWRQAEQNTNWGGEIKVGGIKLSKLMNIVLGEDDWSSIKPESESKPLIRSRKTKKKLAQKPTKFKGV